MPIGIRRREVSKELSYEYHVDSQSDRQMYNAFVLGVGVQRRLGDLPHVGGMT